MTVSSPLGLKYRKAASKSAGAATCLAGSRRKAHYRERLDSEDLEIRTDSFEALGMYAKRASDSSEDTQLTSERLALQRRPILPLPVWLACSCPAKP